MGRSRRQCWPKPLAPTPTWTRFCDSYNQREQRFSHLLNCGFVPLFTLSLVMIVRKIRARVPQIQPERLLKSCNSFSDNCLNHFSTPSENIGVLGNTPQKCKKARRRLHFWLRVLHEPVAAGLHVRRRQISLSGSKSQEAGRRSP